MTPRSKPLSGGSAPCRIDWRPSRCLLAALLTMAVLAPVAVLASEMPRAAAWMLALAAAIHGLGLAAREWRRPPRTLLFTGDGRVLLDGVPIDDVRLRWRGPLVFLSWREPAGRTRRLAWWPDTLRPGLRRELRLAVERLPAARGRPSVAP